MEWRFRPARDLHLPLVARLRSHHREMGLFGAASTALWRSAVRTYLAVAHRFAVEGSEHLPSEPPCVLVANHTSHLDALCLHTALPGPLARRAMALAAGDVFFRNTPSAAFATAALNALPIWRESTTRDDLAFLRKRLLEDGLVYILFPEGTRARDGTLGRFRPGLGAFVAGTPVPVIPCHLEGAHTCWPAARRLPRPGKLILRIGAPLTFQHIANDRKGCMQVAASAEHAVRALGTRNR